MTIAVISYEAADLARDAARNFLNLEPVLNNLIVTLLEARIGQPEPGRYWIARENGEVVGMGLQSPLNYPLNLSAMAPDVATVLADAIGAEGFELAAAAGEARIVARFAGHWAERCKIGAHPVEGKRIYEARTISSGADPPGRMEQARESDLTLLCEWMVAFLSEIGDPTNEVAAYVERRIAAGEIWIWIDGEVRCMSAATAPAIGVSRVQYVYTPPSNRRRGYAEALVRNLTGHLRRRGLLPILFTQLHNASSNAIYRRVGYQAVAELIRYRFDSSGGSHRYPTD